ncbi:hypothetical protein [Streptomyces sp. NPDC087317]|uniref:hypothetical protein n=1 Tax=Streptomyces sp. NPDC087317 TaxID=3365784 RepID=UPI003818FE79
MGLVHDLSRGLHCLLCKANREEEMRTVHTCFEKRLKDTPAKAKRMKASAPHRS